MSKRLDLTKQKFGKLTAIEFERRRKRIYWVCECECGNTAVVQASKLIAGNTKSCGCIVRKGRPSRTREYRSWYAMRDRCLNKQHQAYHRYGGRGIKICDRWLESFENFRADMGDRPEGMTLDRIDNDGNYILENCRWATSLQQSNNSSWTKLDVFKACNVRWLKSIGITQSRIAKRYDMKHSSIHYVVNTQAFGGFRYENIGI